MLSSSTTDVKDDRGSWDYKHVYRDEYPATDFAQREVRSLRMTYVEVPESSKAFVWPDYVVLRNRAAKDHGENVGRYTKVYDYGGGDVWAHCTEVVDMSFGKKYGTLRINEEAIACVGADVNGWRVGYHIMVQDAIQAFAGDLGEKHDGPCEVGNMFRIEAGHSNAYCGNVFSLRDFSWSALQITGGYHDGKPSAHIFKFGGSFITGFSFVEAKFEGSPIRLARGQTIALEGTDTIRIGLIGNQVQVLYGNVPQFSIDLTTRNVIVEGDLIVKGKVRQG